MRRIEFKKDEVVLFQVEGRSDDYEQEIYLELCIGQIVLKRPFGIFEPFDTIASVLDLGGNRTALIRSECHRLEFSVTRVQSQSFESRIRLDLKYAVEDDAANEIVTLQFCKSYDLEEIEWY